jgi:hypothetical protein
MYIVKAVAVSGREVSERLDSVQDAYEKAERWIAASFTDVRLSEEGKRWYHGAKQIRQFIEEEIKRLNDARNGLG